jgi:two-component system, LuxR family, sensor kinase FixL
MEHSHNGLENISTIASRLKSVIETAADGIITINEYGMIEFANHTTCKIFEYDAAALVGQNISLLMPSPHQEQHDDYLQHYRETGIRKIIGTGREVQGRKKNGTIFPLWLSVSEVKLENKHLFIGIICDLTEQQKAEKALLLLSKTLETIVLSEYSEVVSQLLLTNQQLQHEIAERKAAEQALLLSKDELKRTDELLRAALKKERALSELKSRFVSTASHEFRTPLTNIQSSASLMTHYTLTEQQDKREKHFQKIKSNITLLMSVLDDFLSLSCLEEGKMEVHYETIYFNPFCSEIIEEMIPLLKRGQYIMVRYAQEAIFLNTDKKLLKLILVNLFSNASKYSDEGAPIHCLVRKENKKFEIDIADTGIGIPDEDKPHLFEHFFRASNALNIKGTGLGLNIVKRYVELLDGKISYESTLGKGSTFTIRFKIS